MLARDFDYYLPDTVQEATDIYASVQKDGKRPVYYSGGTEIISMARVNSIAPDALIDIKKIPECTQMGADDGMLYFGAAVTLNAIRESKSFPLFSLTAGRIADHTIQCRLTLGGNLAGTIIYHETMLPLLLSDTTIRTAGPFGISKEHIGAIFSSGQKLPPGILVVGVDIDKSFASFPYAHIKKTKDEKIGYPLISVGALYIDSCVRLAASGLCSFPFRFADKRLNGGADFAELAASLASEIPSPVLDDIFGSSDYRLFIFKKTVKKIMQSFFEHGETQHA